MSFKIIGAVLVILGCGGFGFLVAANHRKEEKTLRQLSAALDFMECELQYRLTPLPELCKRAAVQSNGYVYNVLSCLASELDKQNYTDVQDCMNIALSKSNCTSALTQAAFQKLGRSLGRFDLEGQLKGIRSVQEECKRNLDTLTHNQVNRLRSYQTLGLCAGAAIAILFI